MILAPDQYQRTIWTEDIEPNIKEDAAMLFFAHGFNIHFGYIKPVPLAMTSVWLPRKPRPRRAPHLRRGPWRSRARVR